MMSFPQVRVSNTLVRRFVAFVAVLVLGHSMLRAQPITRPVPFVLSARDTSASPFLPGIESGPAGKHGRWHLSADGHYTAADGSRIRFVGTELQWNAVFQTGESAKVLAHRLAKMGFNAVRLNNWDYWGYDDYSFFRTVDDKGALETSSYVINPLQLARFDTLLYELKRAGIYVFIPLHAYHRYVAGDGVPTWDSSYSNTFLMPIFYKEAAARELEFAHWLASHVNPLTGTALGADPQIACWEMAQEFTVPFYWQLGRLNYIDTNNALVRGNYTISYHQSRHLDTLFNDFLKRKYGNDQAIGIAWGGSGSVDTRNLLDNASFETFDMNRWTFQNVAPARSTTLLVSPGQDASPAVMIHITGIDTAHLYYGNIFTNASATLGADSLYEYSFWAKIRYDAQHPVVTRQIYAYIAATETGSANVATPFSIDTTWKKYTFNFRASYPGAQSVGVLFSGDYGDVELDNFYLKHAPETGLAAGESLSRVSIARILWTQMKSVSAARAHDLVEFYDQLERSYFDQMQRALRDTLNVAGLINRSQTNYWANPLDWHALKDGEVTAVHTGWDYVSARPNTPYSDSTWMIRNYSLVKDPGFFALSIAAAGSVVGKAHILEGWTVQSPNQTASESALIPLAYAALQDWDGIFFAPYAVRRDEVFADSILPGYPTYAWSNIASNHALMTLMPAASYAYRTHQIATSSVLDTLKHDANDVMLFPHYADYRGYFGQEGFMYGDQGIVTSLMVRQQFDTKQHQVAAENYYTPGDSLNRSETGEISYAPGQDYFRVQTPTLYAYTGFPRQDLDFPTLRVRRTDNSGDILSFYYQRDTARHTALLSLATRVQNSGVRWVDTLGYSKSWGHAPTLISAAKLDLLFKTDADEVSIQPLDSTGNTLGEPIAAAPVSAGQFSATIDQQKTPAVWFYISEKTNSGVVAGAEQTPTVEILNNPVRDLLTIRSSDPVSKVTIFDALGRQVKFESIVGRQVSIPTASLVSGSYSAVVDLGSGATAVRRFTVLR